MTVIGTALALAWTPEVWARAAGVASGGCIGCHKGASPQVRITAEPMVPPPGGTSLISVHISRTGGNCGGFYLTSNRKGAFSVVGGPVKLVSPTEAVHSAPARSSGGDVVFQVRWTAPAQPGGVDFETWAVSSNCNASAAGGDGGGDARFSTTYGCAGVDAFFDNDHDGFGRDWDRTRLCELTPNHSPKGGDCDDNNPNNKPGATEVCDFYDNNCDGMINEGLPVVQVFRDNDRDGHAARNAPDTDSMMKCATWPGYSDKRDDCNDDDKNIYPGAQELCDNVDNDCNGRVDDGARASCGEGWCRRLAPSCEANTCTPGLPRAEMCNAFDDDCDGRIDNGSNLCPEGRTCYMGYCLTSAEVADAAAANPPPEPQRETDGGAIAGSTDEPSPARRDRPVGCSLGGAAGLPWLMVLALVAAALRRR